MFEEFVAVLRDFKVLLTDFLFGRERHFLENSICIKAPAQEVWDSLWGIGQDGNASTAGYNVESISGKDGLYRISWGENSLYPTSFLNVLETRPGTAFLAEKYFEDDDDPELRQIIAITLVESEDGQSTHVNHFEYAADLGSVDKMIASFETRWMLQMFRGHCENDEANSGEVVMEVDEGEAFWAVLSSAVAFFGCWFFYDLSWAVLIMMALVFHEFGHVIGLSFLGINPSGATILPFVGKAAMEKFPFKNELEHAFCSLMAPAVSLLPSTIFFLFYLFSGHVFFGAAAAIFAFVNLLSFLPVYPFGSERVFNGLIRSIKAEDVFAAIMTVFIVALASSLFYGYYIAALIITLTFLLAYEPAYQYFFESDEEGSGGMELETSGDGPGVSGVAMSSNSALIVLAGLVFCLWAHTTILFSTLSDAGVSKLLGY